MRPNLNLMKATLTGALGGLLFGFDTVVISGAIDALVRLYDLSPQSKGLDGGHRADRHGGRSAGRGPGGAEAGRARDAAHHRRALCGLGHRQRAGLELAVADGLPLRRRAGHRRIVGAGAGVHCRAGPGQVARAAGGRLPVQRGLRHPGGLHLQLPHPHAASGRCGVALAGGRGRAARPRLPGAARSAFPAARAGRPRKEPQRRSPGRAQADGRPRPRRPSWPTFAPRWPRSTPRPTSRSSSGSTAIRCFWPSPSAHSTNWRASTPSSIT